MKRADENLRLVFRRMASSGLHRDRARAVDISAIARQKAAVTWYDFAVKQKLLSAAQFAALMTVPVFVVFGAWYVYSLCYGLYS